MVCHPVVCTGLLFLHYWHAGHTSHLEGSGSWGQQCHAPSSCIHLDVQRLIYGPVLCSLPGHSVHSDGAGMISRILFAWMNG